jgi:hypothetical protein
MNDRGLNLTPTEMLKGYVLSQISGHEQRKEINHIWKKQMQKLHEYGDEVDLSFFRAWFRGKYAQSIRPGKADSENQDFEKIGTSFHRWFKEEHKSLFKLKTSKEFYDFFKVDFPFFVSVYLRMWDACNEYKNELEHVFYMQQLGIAESLSEPLLLASINIEDTPKVITHKMNFVARYLETFAIRRIVNYKKFGQSAIKHTMFNVIKEARNCELCNLACALALAVNNIKEVWDGIESFGLHGQNKKFVKHLLSRISSHVDKIAGGSTTYADYQFPTGEPFQIEHIWADKFEEHREEFDDESDFRDWRNSIGALLLLPRGINQAHGADSYTKKLKHYIKENTYAQTLNPLFYERNPNFLNSPLVQELSFEPHTVFETEDILARQALVQRICEQIWSTDYFTS